MLEGDNLCIINSLKDSWNCPWKVEMLISDYRMDLLKFFLVQIPHIFRKTNSVADKLIHLRHLTPTLIFPMTLSFRFSSVRML